MKRTSSLTMAALLLALGLLLPFLTAQIPEIGSMLLPMHLPVLFGGYLLGPFWGLLLGAATPLMRSMIFGVPVLMPMACAMAFELAAYGFCSGWLYQRLPRTTGYLYLSLVLTMVLGRAAFGLVMAAIAGLSASPYSFSMFWTGTVIKAAPGLILQLLLVPLGVKALQKGRVMAC